MAGRAQRLLAPTRPADRPWLLRGQDHGTQVVLLGEHERHDTTQPPGSVTDARRHWITRYLNARFLRLPAQVEVLVREQHVHDQPGQLQRIQGERHHLQHRGIAAGVLPLSDAIVHWWVLDDDQRARRREAAIWASTGHAAAILDDELYDALAPTRGGYGRLQDFGIRFGYERVVLHLEPHVQADRLQCNTARTLLLLDQEPLPWAHWGEEFAAAMPAEIRQLQERAASADAVPREEAIRQRVTAIMPLYRLSRYRPPRPPGVPATVPAISEPMQSQHDSPPVGHSTREAHVGADTNGTSVTAYAQRDLASREADDGRAEPPLDLPDVAWISGRDGTRALGDLEDEAARYHPSRHELTINADFRAITDLIGHWRRRYQGVPGARTVIEGQVHEWCEQVLVEVVLAARSSSWTLEQFDALLSPSSLTAALLPRHMLHAVLQKRLAQTLGTPRR